MVSFAARCPECGAIEPLHFPGCLRPDHEVDPKAIKALLKTAEGQDPKATLRDQFAMIAMEAQMAKGWLAMPSLANWSYEIADHMMEAREKNKCS